MDVGYYNDIGKRRNSNEDSYIAMPAIGLYIVADGVSSEKAGEVASKLATDGIAQMASYVKILPFTKQRNFWQSA